MKAYSKGPVGALLEATIGQHLEHVVANNPNHLALVMPHQNIRWSYTQFATAKIGAIMVCINSAYRPYELEFDVNKVSWKAVISAHSFKKSLYLDMLKELAPELHDCEPVQLDSATLPHLKTIIRMGEDTA
jgi:fatty-acyl-CoA synthase